MTPTTMSRIEKMLGHNKVSSEGEPIDDAYLEAISGLEERLSEIEYSLDLMKSRVRELEDDVTNITKLIVAIFMGAAAVALWVL